jgi:hypothetical protein
MNSKAKFLFITGVIIVIGVGTYSYLQNQVETNIEAEIRAFNQENTGKYNISYDTVEANPALGEFNLTNVKLEIAEIDGSSVIKNMALKGSLKDGEFVLNGINVDTFDLQSDTINISFSDFELSGQDLSVFSNEDAFRKIDFFPINNFNIKDVKFDIKTPKNNQPFQFLLKNYKMVTDSKAQSLLTFEIDGLELNTVLDNGLPLNMDYGNILLKGVDLSWFDNFAKASSASFDDITNDLDDEETFKKYQQAQNEIIQSLMPVFANYMGMESFEWSNFSLSLPNGSNISFDKLYVKDIERVGEYVVGAKSGWINVSAPNLKGFNPAFDIQLDLLGLTGTTLNIISEANYNAAQKTSVSSSDISIENIMDISLDFTLNNYDPKTYYETTLALYSPQAQQNPDQLAEAYIKLVNDFSSTIKLTDQSIINRFINGYAEQTGADAEALRAQFTGLAIANLSQVFGNYVPENLSTAISGYMASNSSPITFNLTTKKEVTPEVVPQMTAANWGEYIKVEIE